MQGVILAAGRGVRLHPATLSRPKAMVPVAGRPIVEVVLERLRAAGVSDFVVVVGHLGSMVEGFLRERYRRSVRLQFARQREQRGMAHALQAAADLIRGDFILAASDGIYPVAHIRGLMDKHLREGNQATLTLMRMSSSEIAEKSMVAFRGDQIVSVVEKPSLEEARSDVACLSLYVFQRSFLDVLPRIRPSRRGEYEITDGVQLLIDDGGKVGGLFVGERYHLTDLDDLRFIDGQLWEEDIRRN